MIQFYFEYVKMIVNKVFQNELLKEEMLLKPNKSKNEQ